MVAVVEDDKESGATEGGRLEDDMALSPIETVPLSSTDECCGGVGEGRGGACGGGWVWAWCGDLPFPKGVLVV